MWVFRVDLVDVWGLGTTSSGVRWLVEMLGGSSGSSGGGGWCLWWLEGAGKREAPIVAYLMYGE